MITNYIFFLINFIPSIIDNNIIITASPNDIICRDSTQEISWISPNKLDTFKADLYRWDEFIKPLGITNQTLFTKFDWNVPNDLPLGNHYFIKITSVHTNNRTNYSKNTSEFGVIASSSDIHIIIIIIIIGMLTFAGCLYCCKLKHPPQSDYKRYVYNTGSGPIIPRSACTPPPVRANSNPIFINSRPGDDIVTGIMVDDMDYTPPDNTDNRLYPIHSAYNSY